jgi:hydrogenase maturation protease
LLVGVGNVLHHDDGVGIRAAEVMASLPLPPEVEVYDAGTAGPEMAAVLAGRELVVVVDALHAEAEPGTVFRLAAEDLRPAVHTGLSLHELHLLDALKETRLLGSAPARLVVFAVQVEDVSTGIGLSLAVEAALERVLAAAARELGLPPDILEQAALKSSWAS